MRGSFIVLEGVDGSGKTTQAGHLAAWMSQSTGAPTHHLREPGGTALGEALRDLLLDPSRSAWAAETEALLFFASRRQLLEEEIRPALERGEHVVCERFAASTLAYQGQTLAAAEFVLALEALVVPPDLQPDRVLILDIASSDAANRVQQRQLDGFEQRGSGFQDKVREGFRLYRERHPDRCHWLDVTGEPPERVFERIQALVGELLS